MKTKQCTECNATFSFTSKCNSPKYCNECRVKVAAEKKQKRRRAIIELNRNDISIHPKYLSRHYKVTHENKTM